METTCTADDVYHVTFDESIKEQGFDKSVQIFRYYLLMAEDGYLQIIGNYYVSVDDPISY